MATKDYVYLALIAFAAIVFYMHGFYAGLSRRRSVKRELNTGLPVQLPDPAVFTITVKDMIDAQPNRHNRLQEQEVRPSIQCVFGHN